MMTEHPINLAITIFSGFTQGSGDIVNVGMVRLEDAAEAYCEGRPAVRVRRYTWDADVRDMVNNLWGHRPNGGDNRKQHHLIAGYSYGGQTAVDMCWELSSRNDVRVVALALCDPVRRCKWMPGVLGGLGLGKFHIPPVVERVWGYRQKHPRWSLRRGVDVFQPAGHDVVAVDPHKTKIEPPVIVQEIHQYIDNDASFRERFLKSVEQAVADVRKT